MGIRAIEEWQGPITVFLELAFEESLASKGYGSALAYSKE